MDNAMREAAKRDVAAGIPAPGLTDAREIAEEGFIHALPVSTNCVVIYEYIIDRSSGQFKAPSGTIYNVHRVFTHEHTAIPIPDSGTPHSPISMALRKEAMVIPVPARDN